jgi:Rrf2 family protein
MNNGRLATSLHILTVLAFKDKEPVSSAYIAESVNVNAAIIRKELCKLKQTGLIECKEGKGGGSKLAKPAKHIRLSEIYDSVKNNAILGRSNDTNHKCPIGKQMNKRLDELYNEAEEALVKKLHKITLADFISQFDIKK